MVPLQREHDMSIFHWLTAARRTKLAAGAWGKAQSPVRDNGGLVQPKLIEDVPPAALVAPVHFGGNLFRTTFMTTPSI